jgi:hypothetical protein
MTTYDPQELDRLGEIHKQFIDIEPALKEQIVAAGFAGIEQKVLVASTGYTRDTIRLIWRKAGVPPRSPAAPGDH